MRLVLLIVAVLSLPLFATASSCPDLPRNLSRGVLGDDVRSLQEFLVAQELLASGNVTGFFGVLTQGAVQRYQCDHMILCEGSPQTSGWGVVGPRTRAAIAACSLANATPELLPQQTPRNSQVPSTPPEVPEYPNILMCTQDGFSLFEGQYQTFYSVRTTNAPDTCLAHATLRQCVFGALQGDAAYRFVTCSDEATTSTAQNPYISRLRVLCEGGNRILLAWDTSSSTMHFAVRILATGTTSPVRSVDEYPYSSLSTTTTPGIANSWWVYPYLTPGVLGAFAVGPGFTCP